LLQQSPVGAAQHSPLPQHSVPAGQQVGLPGSSEQGSWPTGHGSHVPAPGFVHRAPAGQHVLPQTRFDGQHAAPFTQVPAQHWPLQHVVTSDGQQLPPHANDSGSSQHVVPLRQFSGAQQAPPQSLSAVQH
jgi:hypothetical protein